jgi:hypothetical protein
MAPGASEVYDVHFDAVWGVVFRFGETVRMTPIPADESQPTVPPSTRPPLTFTGTHDAGWLGGGVYRFTADATSDRFNCTYESKHDHGYFEMKRAANGR